MISLRTIGWILLISVSLGTAYLAYGKLLPAAHRSQLTIEIDRLPDEVWTVITEYENFPEWWPSLKNVHREETAEGDQTLWWFVKQDGERFPYRILASERPRRLIKQTADESLPFGSTWAFYLEPLPDGKTKLTIVEEEIVRLALIRPLVTHFVDNEEDIRDFASALQSHLQ